MNPFTTCMWPDLDHTTTARQPGLHAHLLDFRGRLKNHFETGNWDTESWGLSQVAEVEALIRRVGYTRALVSGGWRLFIEYRPCDKTPHYRLLWRGSLFGRVDVQLRTDFDVDILRSRSLPYIQHKLAMYLVHLGYRLHKIRLVTQRVTETDEDDVQTDLREPRLFKVNLENEKRRERERELA